MWMRIWLRARIRTQLYPSRGFCSRLLSGLLLSTLLCSATAAPLLKKGDTLPELQTSRVLYKQVVIRSISARSVTIVHSEGIASVPLRDLNPALQERFAYSPAAEEKADAGIKNATERERIRREAEERRIKKARMNQQQQRYEKLLQGFVNPPVLRTEVDLRPRFFALDLAVKNQGRRPSCAVFAVVSALEFLNAEVAGKPERLSEEYLIWGTRRLLRRPAAPLGTPVTAESAASTEAEEASLDEGFSLGEVVMGLRAFGIPLNESMPNTMGTKMAAIAEPTAAVVEEARARRKVFIHPIPGRETTLMLPNIIHALNAGIPVPVGLRWPHPYSLRRAYLSEQKPMAGYAHAVTLVGYRCPSGKLADCVFIFKNSYGNNWGQGGYGNVTYSYLEKYMIAAALLEVQDRD